MESIGIFYRVFAGLIATLLAVALIAVISFQSINHVRYLQYQQEVLNAPLYLISESILHGHADVNELSDLYGNYIQVVKIYHLNLTPEELKKLKHGLVVLRRELGDYRIIKQIDVDRVISISTPGPSVRHAEAMTLQVLQWLEKEYRTLEQLQESLGIPLQIVESEGGLSELLPGEVIARVAYEQGSMTLYGRTYSTDQLLVLGPLDRFNPIPVQIIIMLGIVAAMLIGIVVYGLVSSLEQRLRKLEQATGRLAQGHLGARVVLHGSDALARLGIVFNSMADQIQRLLTVQREMIRAVSHELRTPVARIRFGMQIIEDEMEDNSYIKAQISGIDSDIQELDELVDEILTYARLDEGGPTIEFEYTDVDVILAQVVSESRPKEGVQVIHLPCELPAQSRHAEIELRYMHRCIQNFVGNACRYANSVVRVRLYIEAGTCRIDVDDDGLGIPESDWSRVFTPFARLDDSRTRASGGYGLGLSIVRRIAHWHGGQAMVGRSDLGGARFSIVWPRRQQNTE